MYSEIFLRMKGHPHFTSITEKCNNGMYFEGFLRMNNRNMAYHVLSYTSSSFGAIEKVEL